MKKVLLTNDDSHSSPLLKDTIECLEKYFDLTIIVPKYEQSWKGKSITCFSPLHVEDTTLFGRSAYTVDGTPADCVNLGIYEICSERPEMVISGLNTGLNTGIGFLLSSGTVGAGFEANIAGIPSIAVSQAFDPATYRHYVAHESFTEDMQRELETSALASFEQTFGFFESHPELISDPITWNINFPHHRSVDTSLVLCEVGKSFYSRIFREREGRFEHHLAADEIRRESEGDCDYLVLQAGNISCTPIDIRRFGELDSVRFAREIKVFKE